MKTLKEIWANMCDTCARPITEIDEMCHDGSCETLPDHTDFPYCRDKETHLAIPFIDDNVEDSERCMLHHAYNRQNP